jgi:hypothetical protein
MRWLGNDRRGTAAQQATRGSARYRDEETAQLSLPLVMPLPRSCIAKPLQNSHAEMPINTPNRRYEFAVKQTLDVKRIPRTF